MDGSLVLVLVTVPAWRESEMALCNRVGSMGTNLEVAPKSSCPNIEGGRQRGKVSGGCARLNLWQRGGEGKLEPSIGGTAEQHGRRSEQ